MLDDEMLDARLGALRDGRIPIYAAKHFGAKAIGEMANNAQPPAIATAAAIAGSSGR